MCTMPVVKCFKCHKEGHYATVCPGNSAKCFQCGRLGHKRKDCPTLGQTASRVSGVASNKPPIARTFNITVQDAVRNTDVMAGTLLLNSVSANVRNGKLR